MIGIAILAANNNGLPWHTLPYRQHLEALLERLSEIADQKLYFITDLKQLAKYDLQCTKTIHISNLSEFEKSTLLTKIRSEEGFDNRSKVFMVDAKNLYMDCDTIRSGIDLMIKSDTPVASLRPMQGRPHQYVRLHSILYTGAVYLLDNQWTWKQQAELVGTRLFRVSNFELQTQSIYAVSGNAESIELVPADRTQIQKGCYLLFEENDKARFITKREYVGQLSGLSLPQNKNNMPARLYKISTGYQLTLDCGGNGQVEVLPFDSEGPLPERILQELKMKKGQVYFEADLDKASGIIVSAYSTECPPPPDCEIPYDPVPPLWHQRIGQVRLPNGKVITGRQQLTLYSWNGEFLAGRAADLENFENSLNKGQISPLILPIKHKIIETLFDYLVYESHSESED